MLRSSSYTGGTFLKIAMERELHTNGEEQKFWRCVVELSKAIFNYTFNFTGGRNCNNGCQEYDDVLMFDPKTSDWKKIGSMKLRRELHAASLVNTVDVIDYCKN